MKKPSLMKHTSPFWYSVILYMSIALLFPVISSASCQTSVCVDGSHSGGMSYCCEKGTGTGTHFDKYDDANYECWSSCSQCLATYTWPAPLSSNAGNVFFVSCSNHEFLSNGASLLPCEWAGDTKTISGHEYLCTKSGQGGLVECCGSDACLKGNEGGVGLTTGQSATYIKGQTFLLPTQPTVVSEAGEKIFTSSTLNGNWQVPEGVTSIQVTVIGAGGGGGGSSSGNFGLIAGGGGGGGGAGTTKTATVAVNSLESLNIIVGAGGGRGLGAGETGTSSGSKGVTGEASSINRGASVLISAEGGTGGNPGVGGSGEGLSGAGGTTGGESGSGPDSSGYGWGGKGGSSSMGTGGAGGHAYSNGGGNGGIGAGGGGGGSSGSNPNDVQTLAGKGGDGYIKISWSQATKTLPLSKTAPPTSPGSGTVTVYCANSHTFVEDLDNDHTACTGAGFTWAANACCGEPEDGLESYATTKYPDKGCWMGKPTASGEKINDQVLFSDGKFIGCIAEGENGSLVALDNAQSSSKLISYLNPNICQNIDGYYCSSENRWQPYPSYDLTFKGVPAGYIPPNGKQAKERGSECCSFAQCWNGTKCMNDQSKSMAQPNFRGDYRCLDGAWKISIPKYTKDRTKIGHCPVDSDCLVNPDTNSCLSTNQYTGNDLCSSGLWTTRTRAIALAMLSMARDSPYSLYCDAPQKALTQGPIKYGSGTSPFLSPHPVCVMNAGDDIMVGMGFDGMPEEGGMHMLFDGAECANVPDDGGFHSCTGAPVFFNKKLMAFIKGNSGFEVESVGMGMTTEDSLDPSILSRLKSLMAAIASKWNQLFVTQSTRAYLGDSNYNGINKTLEFDKLYMVRSNSERSIFGYYKIDGSTHHALIRYSGFSSDICDLVDEYKAANTNVFSTVGSGGATVAPGSSMIAGIGCVKENENTYAVLMQGKSTSNFNVARIGQAWEDFTVKLRVS